MPTASHRDIPNSVYRRGRKPPQSAAGYAAPAMGVRLAAKREPARRRGCVSARVCAGSRALSSAPARHIGTELDVLDRAFNLDQRAQGAQCAKPLEQGLGWRLSQDRRRSVDANAWRATLERRHHRSG